MKKSASKTSIKKIKNLREVLLISFLIFCSAFSFFQINFTVINSKSERVVEIYDKSKAFNGDILYYANKKCQLLDHAGNVLYNFPGSIPTFFGIRGKSWGEIDVKQTIFLT